jgi:uncharacterized protein YbjT (DUF2867 family)
VKVLIIGATGATGQILMREALAQGHEVTALARNPSALAPEDHRLRVLQGNALDASTVGAAVAGLGRVCKTLMRERCLDDTSRFDRQPMGTSETTPAPSKAP